MQERPGWIRLDVAAVGPAYLVLSNTHHKYWRAFIGGKEVDLQPTNIAYSGITIPTGDHVIEVRYRNPLVLAFGVVSLATLAGLGLVMFLPNFRKKPAAIPRE